MVAVNANPVELIKLNSRERIDIALFDEDDNPIDASELSLTVTDLGDTVIYEDDFFDPPTGSGRIVKPAETTGRYYIEWGDPNASQNQPNQTETNTPGDLIFCWQAVGAAGTEQETIVQVAKVVTSRTLRLIPYFRNLLDKVVKEVDDDPENPCFLGYTDSQLIMYLEGGLQSINAYQPYPCFASLDAFCVVTQDKYRQILLEAGLLAGVISQQLFAIDTDIPNFSDNGNAFVIQHQPQLAAFFNQISQRLDKIIPMMKLHFVDYGMVHVQAGPNYRLAQLVSAAPLGATFRNIFFSS